MQILLLPQLQSFRSSTQHALCLKAVHMHQALLAHVVARSKPLGLQCRCQSLPEGSGRPLANLRAWGAELFNSLRTGWSDQPKQAAQPGGPKPPLPPPQQGGEASRDGEAPSSALAAEQQGGVRDEDGLGLPVARDSEAEEEQEREPPEEGSWEHWEEVRPPCKHPCFPAVATLQAPCLWALNRGLLPSFHGDEILCM